MTSLPPAHPGHYDAQALVTAIGQDDADGARAMLDTMSAEEAKTTAFYLAETFSMSSPLTHPDHVSRSLFRFTADEVERLLACVDDALDKPTQAVATGVLLGGPGEQIQENAAVLVHAIATLRNLLSDRLTTLRELADNPQGGDRE